MRWNEFFRRPADWENNYRKSDWSDACIVANALEYFTLIPERRKVGERWVPFQVERLDYRNQEREQFYRSNELYR